MRRLVLIALATTTLAGCGDGSDEPSAAPPPSTEVEVTVWPEGRPGPSSSANVSCAEPEADTPECRAAAAVEAADLEPVPADAVCTQIFGGAQQARIEGTLRGEAVDVELDRRNGCEIARHRAAKPLLDLAGR